MRNKKSVINAKSPKNSTAADKDAGASKAPIAADVVRLAEHAAGETIEITELSPYDGEFIGKHINPDGSLTEYPNVSWWRQHVAHVPATVSHLFAYLREARTRNICLIRGAPANPEREKTRRLKAGIYGSEDRGDHGFLDTPTKLFCLDIDGTPMEWRADPEGAIRRIVTLLGEPWSLASFVWFFSAKHGLERDKRGRWKGKISDGDVRMRLAFIATRALNEAEACALTKLAMIPKIDFRISLCVQPNYIKRPHWIDHPERDPLGDIPTIGWVKGESEHLAIPDNLEHKARWARAQGLTANIAEHPDATTAVRSIGSDGSLRAHLMSAVIHLLNANPIPEVVSFADHSITVVDQLRKMVERWSEEIDLNLKANKRTWGEVKKHLSQMSAWAYWVLNHPAALRRKSIKLIKEEKPQRRIEITRDDICARVVRVMARTLRRAHRAADPKYKDLESLHGVELITAPTGSWKSTLMRRVAVMYVKAHPDKTVVILMPRHQLGREQLDLLAEEHPNGNYTAIVWYGRQAWDPDVGDGKEEKICRRAKEAKALEDNLLSVDRHLCKQGRGKKAIVCPLAKGCKHYEQKETEANIIFASHEVMVHKKPKAFGDIGLILIDESCVDAFMFGVDINDPVELPLDKLRDDAPGADLTAARNALYQVFDKLSKRAGVDRRALHDKKFTYEVVMEE